MSVTPDRLFGTEALGIWVQLQGLVGQTYQLRVLDPGGAARGPVELYDLLGRVVASENLGFLTAGEQTLEHALSSLAAGIYLMRVQAGGWSPVFVDET